MELERPQQEANPSNQILQGRASRNKKKSPSSTDIEEKDQKKMGANVDTFFFFSPSCYT